jgi:hypothetical protein
LPTFDEKPRRVAVEEHGLVFPKPMQIGMKMN